MIGLPRGNRPSVQASNIRHEPDAYGVVGGGLAGLVASRHLAAAGGEVTCYEREQRVGGRVRTEAREGFRFDRGFQVLFTAYPAVHRELDLGALELRRFPPARSSRARAIARRSPTRSGRRHSSQRRFSTPT